MSKLTRSYSSKINSILKKILKEEEKNVNNNNLFWSELKMLQMKK